METNFSPDSRVGRLWEEIEVDPLQKKRGLKKLEAEEWANVWAEKIRKLGTRH